MVLVDLGEMATSRHSALVASVVDQVILVTAEGDPKRVISDTSELLDRVAPDRHFLVFDEARPLDPMLSHDRGRLSLSGWRAQLFSYFKPPLEAN